MKWTLQQDTINSFSFMNEEEIKFILIVESDEVTEHDVKIAEEIVQMLNEKGL